MSIPEVDFSHAFQPIVDGQSMEPASYEVLLRGIQDQPAASVFASIDSQDLEAFDQYSRERAIALAAKLQLSTHLNLNFFPNALLSNDGQVLADTIAAAERSNIPADHLVVELTETDLVKDVQRLVGIVNRYRRRGLCFAIDDFGSGYAGLNLLSDLQPEQLKLDMWLIRDIHRSGPRQSIVAAIASICVDLGITLVAEGVESIDEYLFLRDTGVDLFQGYLFAKPGFECLPQIQPPQTDAPTSAQLLRAEVNGAKPG